LTKTLVSAGFRSSAREYLQLEGFSQATAFATRDHAEGVRAFLAKEKPGFEGR
jgi:enoyl-CoA hydratase/carnithine racemase